MPSISVSLNLNCTEVNEKNLLETGKPNYWQKGRVGVNLMYSFIRIPTLILIVFLSFWLDTPRRTGPKRNRETRFMSFYFSNKNERINKRSRPTKIPDF